METSEGRNEGMTWYYRPWIIFLAILCFGPLALPLVWFRPRTHALLKTVITVATLAVTVWAFRVTADYYQKMVASIEELAKVLKETN